MHLRAIVRNLVVCAVLAASGRAALVAQSFTVAAESAAVTIHPGDSNVAVPVTLRSSGTLTDPVTVTLQGLPSGITVTPAVMTGSGTASVLLTASVSAGREGFPATSTSLGMDAYTAQATVVAFAGGKQASAPIAVTVSINNPAFQPAASKINLPILRIDTGGAAIADKTTDVPGTVTITSADGQTSFLPGVAGTDNTATFHIHGNTTAEMPKKPYHVKLNTGTDLLAGMGLPCGYVTGSGKATCDKSKSYILLANYDDKTMLRDWAASALANSIPIGGAFLGEAASSPSPSGTATLLPWAAHSLFVETYLNGQYEGLYQLIEEVKVDSHRVDINEMAATDIAGKALTGGYLLDIDTRRQEDFTWITPHAVYVGLEDPDFTPEVPEQTSYIQSYVNTAEGALFAPNFTDPVLGWRAYFDTASVVNFYLVNDVMGNLDGGAFLSSDYLYKDKNNPLLYMGPVWDFDISSGNTNYAPIVSPTVPWTQTMNPWYPQWFQDPGFKSSAQQQWNALKSAGVFTSWLSSISAEAATLQQGQANNFGRWPMQGVTVWPNPEAVGSYDGEVSYMLNWIHLRMAYMDAFLNSLPATSTMLLPPTGTLRTGTAASLSASVTGSSPTGSVTFTCNNVVVGQAALDGSGHATLSTSTLPPGGCLLDAYYGGDSKNAYSVSPATSVTVLPALVATTSSVTSTSYSSTVGTATTFTAAVLGESGNGAPTGTFTFSANGTPLGTASVAANGIATLSTSALPGGTAVVQASYSGDTTYAPSVSSNVSIAVARGLATVIIAASASALSLNQSFTLTSNVAEPAGGVAPTGTVTFYDGSTVLGQATLSNGTATLNSGGLTVGVHTITAAYSGDGNYLPASSPSSGIVLGVGLDFSLSLDSTGPAALSRSQTTTLHFALAPVNGAYPGTVTFAVNGLPAGLTATVSPGSVDANSGPVTVTVSLQESPSGLVARSREHPALLAAVLLLPLLGVGSRRRAKGLGSLFAVPVFVCGGVALAALNGCGGSNPSQAVQVTLVASSNGVQHSATATVTAH